jgi:TIR domain
MGGASDQDQPIPVFISYSHKDENHRDKLVAHLRPAERDGVLKIWYDRKISPGSEWAAVISKEIDSARIILLLISIDFCNSKYCYEIEMERALARHDSNEARVIPVILRPSDWKSSPFGKLGALPRDGKPVVTYPLRDAAYTEIAIALRRVAEELRKKSTTRASS